MLALLYFLFEVLDYLLSKFFLLIFSKGFKLQLHEFLYVRTEIF